MGENSAIAWTHHTFNPWVGCQRVSPGCVNCYAETYDKRVGGAVDVDGIKKLRWGAKAPRIRTTPANWKKPLKWDRDAAARGERHRVFCASLADVFEDREDLDRTRLDLFDIIRRTPHLDWLLLTKRPASIGACLQRARELAANDHGLTRTMLTDWFGGSPPPNVWLGTTVEDQARATERIPQLVAIPARVRFLSCEPLLEEVDLNQWLDEDATGFVSLIQWVIIGGESGAKARPFHLSWARKLVAQCRDAPDTAPFVKQLGAAPQMPVERFAGDGLLPVLERLQLKDRAGGDMDEWPEDLRVREFPASGR